MRAAELSFSDKPGLAGVLASCLGKPGQLAAGRFPHCTTIFPVIFGRTEQRYGYIPAFVNWKENNLRNLCHSTCKFISTSPVPLRA